MSETPAAVSTPSMLLQALRACGVAHGDTLMVHSSLKSFGTFDGGPKAVIDALLEAVGPAGHVVMPALTATYVSLPKTDGLAFHPARTPSRVGAITELFRKRKDAVRSGHPTHSLACIGPRAAAWMAGHGVETTTFGGWDGAYAHYVRADGGPSKLVFLGVTMVCNTTLHAVEEWLGLPYMAEAMARVEDDAGTAREVRVTQAPLGPRGFYKPQDRHHLHMARTGRIRQAACGPASVSVLDARACVAETVRQELATPGALLKDSPDCEFSTKGRAAILTMQDEVRARADEIRRRGLSE
ncbi:MAG: AAC(3) family N-acetyltransferase [Planctomycetota bacterium]|nr:AAC(3) family N-acetyltransferase [Planctomycetota bacterium]